MNSSLIRFSSDLKIQKVANWDHFRDPLVRVIIAVVDQEVYLNLILMMILSRRVSRRGCFFLIAVSLVTIAPVAFEL